MRHTVFEGELPTIQYLLEMLEQYPGLPSHTIQMLIRLFFITLILDSMHVDIFNQEMQPLRYRGAKYGILSSIEWNEYLVENSHNQDF